MRAVYAASLEARRSAEGPRDRRAARPEPPEAGRGSRCSAASLNHHDLWTLRGVGIKAEQLPMILGCDAAGIDESTGEEVVVHSVINAPGWEGDDTARPEAHAAVGEAPGLARRVRGRAEAQRACPSRPSCPGPRRPACRRHGSPPTGCCSPSPGCGRAESVLVQGASGGVATACIAMARAAGLRVYATARTEAEAGQGRSSSARTSRSRPAPACPRRSTPSWRPSARRPGRTRCESLRPGGRIVICGATSRPEPARRPQPVLLPAAAGGRLDDGHEGASWRPDRVPARDRAAAAHRPRAAAGAGGGRATRDGVRRPGREDRPRSSEA